MNRACRPVSPDKVEESCTWLRLKTEQVASDFGIHRRVHYPARVQPHPFSLNVLFNYNADTSDRRLRCKLGDRAALLARRFEQHDKWQNH